MSAYNYDCDVFGHEVKEIKPGVWRCTWCGEVFDDYE